MSENRWLGGSADAAEERRAVSFLLRFWFEPREAEHAASPLRGYIRHLQTGEEHYVSDLEQMAEYVLRQLRDAPTEPTSRNGDEPTSGGVME